MAQKCAEPLTSFPSCASGLQIYSSVHVFNQLVSVVPVVIHHILISPALPQSSPETGVMCFVCACSVETHIQLPDVLQRWFHTAALKQKHNFMKSVHICHRLRRNLDQSKEF